MLTKHRYDKVKYAGWERMEWQCSKCGCKLEWVRDVTA